METKGIIQAITPTLNGAVLMVQVNNTDGLNDLVNKDIRLKMTRWYNKRSITANNYFYVLIGQIADVLNVSKTYVHNKMLRQYGQLKLIDNKAVYVVIPETEETQRKVDEDEYTHLKPTSEVKVGKDGTLYRTYMMVKGSHELNTKEMGILIDGVVAECKELGIPTMTSTEIEMIKEKWGINVG